MDLETINKAIGIVGAVAVILTPLLRRFFDRSSTLTQRTRGELDLLALHLSQVSEDQPYSRFLKSISKEKVASAAFGVPIANQELGPLMTFYDLGIATTTEIRIAWGLKNYSNGALTFRLGRLQRVLLGLAVVYWLAVLAGMIHGLFLLRSAFLLKADWGTIGLITSYLLIYVAILYFWALGVLRAPLVAIGIERRRAPVSAH